MHRDLKPGNVLLAADGPRVIDFGIARVLAGTRLTATDSVMGTPSYMSPEQAQGSSVDPPSDVFSLGGVVYFAATGEPPFGGGIPAALLYRIVFDAPGLDGLPPRLRSLVATCLDKNPATRPTPAQLATALMPAMPAEGLPASSRLAFWPEPVARFIQEYQDRLDQEGAQAPQAPFASQAPVASQASQASFASQAPGTWPSAANGPAPGWQSAGRPTTRQAAGGGRHRGTGSGAGLDRRRALAALAGAAAAGLGIAGWEAAQHISTGSSAKKLIASQVSLKPVPPGTMVWRYKANGTVGSVATAGPVVYGGTNGHSVFALAPATGKQLWQRTTTNCPDSRQNRPSN